MSKKKKIVLSIMLALLVAIVVYVIVCLSQDAENTIFWFNEYKDALKRNPTNKDLLLNYKIYLKRVIIFFINVYLLISMTVCILYCGIKKILKK